MFVGFSLLLLTFSSAFNQYDCAVICFSCTEMLEDEKCQHVTTCQDNEVCFIQKYRTTNDKILYDVGCAYNQICPLNRTMVAFGKRSVDHSHIMCHKCCNGNVCNSAFTCDDNLKPHTLNCLSCGGVDNVYNCNTTTACDKDEACFIQKYRTATNKEYFDLGCKRSAMCVNRNPPGIFGRRTDEERHLLCEFCCSENSLCNRNLSCGQSYPSECADISVQTDGVNTVYPGGKRYSKPVYCVIRNGTKWTVIHRRFDYSVNFSRTWEEYKQGFGNVNGEYWLGNEAIHLISSSGHHKLHIIMELVNGHRFYADYSLFKLNNESSQYLLNVTGYSGTAGDSMDRVDPHKARANGVPFSTRDRDNDESDDNCARTYQSGWWFASCNYSDLNGNYTKYEPGFIQRWYKNLNYAAIRRSEMMISK